MNWEVSQILANKVSELCTNCSCECPPRQTKIPERSVFLSMSTERNRWLSSPSLHWIRSAVEASFAEHKAV